jgi:hypothetical protein
MQRDLTPCTAWGWRKRVAAAKTAKPRFLRREQARSDEFSTQHTSALI